MFQFNPYSPEVDADPFEAYAQLREDFPVFWSEEAGMWVLSRYEDILRALNDWETYSSASGNLMDEFEGRAGATLGTTDPPRHDRLRMLIQKAVTKRALDHLLEPARVVCAKHMDALEGRESFDFVEDISAKITVDLMVYLFALPEEGREDMRKKAVLMVQSDPVTRSKGPEHIAAYHWMRDYAARLIEERKKNPGEDLMSQFILAEIDGEKLDDREVQMTVTTLIMAGIESLSGFLSMMALNLADFP